MSSKGVSSEDGRLLGSRRLAKASNIFRRQPLGQGEPRLLGSKRLQQARMILLGQGLNINSKVMGSRRLAKARDVLLYGITEIRQREQEAHSAAPAEISAFSQQPIGMQNPSLLEVPPPASDNILVYGGRVANAEQQKGIATIRQRIEAMQKDSTPWMQRLEDVDILRYIMWHKSVDVAWTKIQITAKWREDEKVDGILSENLDDVFEAGKEEMLYLPPDKQGRPILLYRSALHQPGRISPERFTRYVIQQTEKARIQYRLGIEVQSIVIVDRIGSGLKNQDPALLKVLLPVIVDHYPEYVGLAYVAPISTIFYAIWKLIQVFSGDF